MRRETPKLAFLPDLIAVPFAFVLAMALLLTDLTRWVSVPVILAVGVGFPVARGFFRWRRYVAVSAPRGGELAHDGTQ
jgi:hypothetical protein